MYLFLYLAALDICCCVWALSTKKNRVWSGGCYLGLMLWLLNPVASLAVEHTLQAIWTSSAASTLIGKALERVDNSERLLNI